MAPNPLIDRSKIAKDWHARGFSCGLWIDHAGREWSCDAHQTDELFMVMSGELELEMEGQSTLPSLGEEIRIPAGVSHIIRNVGGKTARWLYGQPREAIPSTQTPHSFQEIPHSTEVRRKRGTESRKSALEVSKEA
ncbi:MAG: cupin domain-containing protein [Nitrospirota bacterium]|nr:MAG: cupin domain-containing protein [Nitrospirota bacterium]